MNPLLAALIEAGLLDRDIAERLNRQLNPQAARTYAEGVVESAFRQGLLSQQSRVIDLLRDTNGAPTNGQLARFWRTENDNLRVAVEPALLDIASEQAVLAAVTTGANDRTWNLINEAVLDWAQDYYANADVEFVGSIPNLNITSRTRFLRHFTDWQRGELERAGFADGLPQLIRSLEPVFGPSRAENIASTETTRIFTEGTRAAGNANPTVAGYRFLTSADELVCPICSPGQGLVARKGDSRFPDGGDFPPRHPRCRCSVTPETTATLELPFGTRVRAA